MEWVSSIHKSNSTFEIPKRIGGHTILVTNLLSPFHSKFQISRVSSKTLFPKQGSVTVNKHFPVQQFYGQSTSISPNHLSKSCYTLLGSSKGHNWMTQSKPPGSEYLDLCQDLPLPSGMTSLNLQFPHLPSIRYTVKYNVTASCTPLWGILLSLPFPILNASWYTLLSLYSSRVDHTLVSGCYLPISQAYVPSSQLDKVPWG